MIQNNVWVKQKIFIGLLSSIVILLTTQIAFCMIQPTLINLHPHEYSKKFHYYPSAVKLDR